MSISKGMWVLVGLAMFGLLIGGQCGAPGPDIGDPDDNGGSDHPGDWDGGPTVTVYVVDQPAGAGEFRELPDALAYLCAHLPDGESGVVVIRTERELVVETLTFSCPVSIEADSGIQPQIVGPGAAPLVVNASGRTGADRAEHRQSGRRRGECLRRGPGHREQHPAQRNDAQRRSDRCHVQGGPAVEGCRNDRLEDPVQPARRRIQAQSGGGPQGRQQVHREQQ